MKEINILDLGKLDVFKMIGQDWMLVTAGSEKNFNTMTASWGGLGVLWNKNVSFCFVRPQRYTFEFMEKNSYYSLSFYDDKYKNILKKLGTKSGRDTNKIEESGLTICHDQQAPYFKEAKIVLICKKIYAQFISPDCMLENLLKTNYTQKDYHKFYVGEIKTCLIEN